MAKGVTGAFGGDPVKVLDRQYSTDNHRSNQRGKTRVTGYHKGCIKCKQRLLEMKQGLESQSTCNDGYRIRCNPRSTSAKANRHGKPPVRGESFPVRPPAHRTGAGRPSGPTNWTLSCTAHETWPISARTPNICLIYEANRINFMDWGFVHASWQKL